jgi:transcriptional regulator
MYIPGHFCESDQSTLIRFVHENSFGLLVSWSENGPVATHLPMLLEVENGDLVLYGHVAKANPHWRLFLDDESTSVPVPESLVIFQGAHAYISPTWYESRGVPTWNYTAVHAYGKACLIDDRDARNDIVLSLSDKFEKERSNPWIPDYEGSMLDGIVAFKLPVRDMQGKFKLSQNKSRNDRDGVIAGLGQYDTDNERLIAEMMTNL